MAQEDEFWEGGGLYRATDHPVVEIFARQRVRYLAEHGALQDADSLLDVGAGSGFSSRYYPESLHVVASDFAGGMLRANPLTDRARCSADTLPFADASFDIVTCWELLHHLDDPVAAIRDMWRVARRRIILFEPNRIHPGHIVLGLTRPEERRSLRFSPGHMRRLLQTATGRRAERHERCGLLFPNVTPLPLARLMNRLPYRVPLVGISQLLVLEK
ncbi:MAG: class I SAM-dependent methyltransferase [Deltaproteobacteria bacterium]